MINEKGILPLPKLILIEDEEMYLVEKPAENLMRKFNNAVGISEKILNTLDIEKKVFVKVSFPKEKKRYICFVKDFINSDKTFMNDGHDKQYFVSIYDMKEYHKKPFWMKNLK